MDSNAQIPALALAAPTNYAFVDCFTRLKDAGIRLFTTERLFEETFEHFLFASRVIRENGAASALVVGAAMGQSPYRKSNQFLEGFIRWQSIGNLCDWDSYLYQATGHRNPKRTELKSALARNGIETVPFEQWPGFAYLDIEERDALTDKIVEMREARITSDVIDTDLTGELRRKAEPESEAYLIIRRERDGQYQILSRPGERSPAWFVSDTSILNAFDAQARITWQTEAFLRFGSTIIPVGPTETPHQAFETILIGFAQSGLNLLDQTMVGTVLGGVIDQAMLSIGEQRELYAETLEQKYGEPAEKVLARLSPANRLLGAVQLANEMAESQRERLKRTETALLTERKRADAAERTLQDVDRYRRKMEEKRERGRKHARKGKAKKRKKK